MAFLLLTVIFCNFILMTFRSYRKILGVVAPLIVMSLSLIIVLVTFISKIAFIIAIYINLSLLVFSIFVIIRVSQIETEGPIDDFTEYWVGEKNDLIPVGIRVITTIATKMVIWQRDNGRCVECDSIQNLEFRYIVPISEGGFNTDKNMQLLCQNCKYSN